MPCSLGVLYSIFMKHVIDPVHDVGHFSAMIRLAVVLPFRADCVVFDYYLGNSY